MTSRKITLFQSPSRVWCHGHMLVVGKVASYQEKHVAWKFMELLRRNSVACLVNSLWKYLFGLMEQNPADQKKPLQKNRPLTGRAVPNELRSRSSVNLQVLKLDFIFQIIGVWLCSSWSQWWNTAVPLFICITKILYIRLSHVHMHAINNNGIYFIWKPI